MVYAATVCPLVRRVEPPHSIPSAQRAQGKSPIHIIDPVSTYHLKNRRSCHGGGTADLLPESRNSRVFTGSLRFKEVVRQPSKKPTYENGHGRNQFGINNLDFKTSLSVCLPTKQRPAEAGATVSPAHRCGPRLYKWPTEKGKRKSEPSVKKGSTWTP